jgi:hypothetical protein
LATFFLIGCFRSGEAITLAVIIPPITANTVSAVASFKTNLLWIAYYLGLDALRQHQTSVVVNPHPPLYLAFFQFSLHAMTPLHLTMLRQVK